VIQAVIADNITSFCVRNWLGQEMAERLLFHVGKILNFNF